MLFNIIYYVLVTPADDVMLSFVSLHGRCPSVSDFFQRFVLFGVPNTAANQKGVSLNGGISPFHTPSADDFLVGKPHGIVG